jgi:2',3'-cyclic-nucleotide 2'-phosphodiesterase (5'-nucleotidase family)
MKIRASVSLALLLSALTMAASCRKAPETASAPPSQPTVRLYVLSSAAGALEPCGCTKDQLGGIDHVASFIQSQAARAPQSVVVGAGPMLFMDPKLDQARSTQDLWKAEALASSFGDLRLAAWAPGANDWAAGPAELARLDEMSRAELLASNLRGSFSGKATRIVDSGGYRIGLVGVSDPVGPVGAPQGVEVSDPKTALQAALADLKKAGAQIFVALVAMERGKALRLAELVPGYHAFIVGKPYDKGEGNDAPMPPALVGDTLVVQPQGSRAPAAEERT